MSKHPIVHVEISSKDHEATGRFYEQLFGWQIRQIPEMDYATFMTGENEVGGGFNPITPDSPAGSIIFYVNTDDINETLAKAESLGAEIVSQPHDIPGVGAFAVFLDPNGNRIAVLEPVDMPQENASSPAAGTA